MEYAEYGDPAGEPLFFFHGYLGSCHQAELAHASALRQGIRIIAPNRPGIGRSTPSKFQMMTDYAADINELADALGIDTFAVIGASGGGCFALANAYALPERVRIAGVFGAIGPMNVLYNVQHMCWFRRLFLQGCHGYPDTAKFLLSAVVAFCRHYPQVFYRMLVRTSELEKNLLRRSDVQRILWKDYESIFLQNNGIDALLLETKLYFNWGFDLRQFPDETPVLFWHGKDDAIAPCSTISSLAQRLRNGRAMLCPGGHISFLLTQADNVMCTLKHEWDALDREPYVERKTERVVPAPFITRVLSAATTMRVS